MFVTRVGSSSSSSKDVASSNPKGSEACEKVGKKAIVVESKLSSGGTKRGKRKQPEDASVKTKQKAKRAKIYVEKGCTIFESSSIDHVISLAMSHVIIL